jgi:hypothetical protein
MWVRHVGKIHKMQLIFHKSLHEKFKHIFGKQRQYFSIHLYIIPLQGGFEVITICYLFAEDGRFQGVTT